MAQDTTTRSDAPATSSGTVNEVFVGLIWLGVTMWTAHAMITGNADDVSGTLGAAAAALPGVISATLLTGASIGHTASSRFQGAGRRLLAGLAAGTFFGLAAAAGIRFAYGMESSITVLAVIVGAASVLGGAAAILPDPVLGAGLWATTWVFFAGVIFGVLPPQLTLLLGGGGAADPAAQAAASIRSIFVQSALTGLLAGVYAFRSLSGERRAWLWYSLAGALPGLLLLAAVGLTRLGGASVLNLVDGFSPGQPALAEFTDFASLRHALIVLAVGGVVAMIAAVRTLGRSADDPADSSSSDDD